MPDISLLSIVGGRRPQLHNLLRGVAAQTLPPTEVIIVFMNEEVPDKLPDPGCKMYLESIHDSGNALPLAAARNRAASLASGTNLAFLDVDCIPAPDYLERLYAALVSTQGLVMGDVHYLPDGAVDGNWTMEKLDAEAVRHPKRPALPDDQDLIPLAYQLFWSLSFGVRADDFARLGGFDQKYRGYGAEDTDFAFMARQVRLPLYACNARVYHQYHPSYSPPYNHLEDIVANAVRFHDKWQIWPMEGWLKQFDKEGYISWKANSIRILKDVDSSRLAAARSQTPYG